VGKKERKKKEERKKNENEERKVFFEGKIRFQKISLLFYCLTAFQTKVFQKKVVLFKHRTTTTR
jgi:hypothetical protein